MTVDGDVGQARHVAPSRFRDVLHLARTREEARRRRDHADQRLVGGMLAKARLEQHQIDRDLAEGRTFAIAQGDTVHTVGCEEIRPLLDRHELARSCIVSRDVDMVPMPGLYYQHEVLEYFLTWRPCPNCTPELHGEARHPQS